MTCLRAGAYGEDFAKLCQPDESTQLWLAPRLRELNLVSVIECDDDAVAQLIRFVRTRAKPSHADSQLGAGFVPLQRCTVPQSSYSSFPTWVQDAINTLLGKGGVPSA